ncbi:MAG: S8 family serine peptidase [Ilumatobacteraceae bacterium]
MLPILCAASTITALSIPLDGAHAAPAATARYLVQFRQGVAPDAEASQARADGVRVERVYRRALAGMVADLTPQQAAALASDPQVRSIERDRIVHATVDQTRAPWGLDRSDQRALPLNGTYSYPAGGGAGVKVYVIDTGVRSTHVELAGRVAPGRTLIEDGMGTEDCQGHGTHVAATVAGTTYGVAKAATIVPVRVLDCLGSGSVSAVVTGLDWVLTVNAGAPAVVNMSLGGAPSTIVDDAVRRVIRAGVPVVAAAGNAAYSACLDSPSRVPEAITVGAVQSDDNRAQYSNVGPCVDLFAPGSAIPSAWWTSDTATNVLSGTSMASPHVAGAAALLVAANPGISPAAVSAALIANSTVGAIPDPGLDSPNRLLFVATTVPSAPLAVAVTSLPGATRGAAYSSSLAAVGGTAPYSWAVAAGALPAGLTLSAGGAVAGTPTTAGTSTFTARVTDSKGAIATGSVTLTVASSTTTAKPGAFGKSSPSNGATGRSRTSLTFSWAGSSGATSYQLCFDTVRNGACSTSWVTVGNATKWTASNLLATTTYEWQVRAVNASGVTDANAGTWWSLSTSK